MVKATTRQLAAGHKMMKRAESAVSSVYGNTGFGVSNSGIHNFKKNLTKDQHTQEKLWNFENWCSGEVSESAII